MGKNIWRLILAVALAIIPLAGIGLALADGTDARGERVALAIGGGAWVP